jgi:hypothetical protein
MSCPAVVATTFSPAVIVAHAPMMVHVSVTFHAGTPAICSQTVRIVMHGLPLGCGVSSLATFTCVPQVSGLYHVQTVVFALNTANPIVDTLVVR